MATPVLLRLCLVRFGASFLLILTTGILNRILIVDFGVAAAIVTVILSFQHLTSPLGLLTGYLSDRFPIRGRRRVPWIRFWTTVSALLVPWMPLVAWRMGEGGVWLLIGAVFFGVFGLGLKAANLLVSALLVDSSSDLEERGRQLNQVWLMAIVGFILAGIVFGQLLPVFDPQSTADLDWFQSLSWWTAAFVVVLTWLGTWRVEASSGSDDTPEPSQSTLSIRESIRTVFQSPGARTIFLFLFLADFSFFVQEFVLEAFGGEVFELPVGVTTSFNVTFGVGMVVSMLAAGSLGPLLAVFPVRRVLAGSCLLGACSFAGLAFAAIADAATALHTSVFILGVAKGLYNVGLAHLFTRLAHSRTAGVLMGAWGAFGGFAVALGALSGGILQGWAEHFVDDLSMSYGLVFGVEVLGLLAAMLLILRVQTLRLEK